MIYDTITNFILPYRLCERICLPINSDIINVRTVAWIRITKQMHISVLRATKKRMLRVWRNKKEKWDFLKILRQPFRGRVVLRVFPTLHDRTRRLGLIPNVAPTLVEAFHDTLAIVENVISLYRPCSSRFYYVYRCYFRGKRAQSS